MGRMNLYRGKQTIAHVGIGIGIAAVTRGLFGAQEGAQLLATIVYVTGREIEDFVEGGDLGDGWRDALEILAGCVVGIVIQFFFA